MSLVYEVLEQAARRGGGEIAIQDELGVVTYAELLAQSATTSHALLSAGVLPGERIAVIATPNRNFVACLFACSKAGITLVPVSTSATQYELDYITSDSRVVASVMDPSDISNLVFHRQAPIDSKRFTIGVEAFLLLYTSGSTGRPKAIVCGDAMISFAASAIEERLNYKRADRVFCRLPLHFDYGLYQVLLCAKASATLVLADRGNDASLLKQIRDSEASVVPLVPSLARILVDLWHRDRGDAPIRLFTNTGEHLGGKLLGELRNAFPNAAVQLMYGLSECKRVSIAEPDEDLRHPGTVGRPLSGTSVRIVNDTGESLRPGAEGQIVVEGPHVMWGYWPDAPFQISPLSGERVLHTGDRGFIDQDGRLYFSDRASHLFKVRGVRTSVAEIEAAALSVPEISQAAVVPPDGSNPAVLYLVTNIGLKAAVFEMQVKLDRSKMPERCLAVERLPLGPNGKIDRRQLQRWSAER